MRDVKRLELVVDAVHVDEMLRALRGAGVDGYTVLRGASGWGDRGARQQDGISGVFENCVVLCAVETELIGAVVGVVQPILKRYGGVGMVSDVQWVVH
ncbi:MAG: transcriptional regulator [Planctomycetota bacterium]